MIVVVAWILAMLTAFTLSFGRDVRTDVRLSHQRSDAATSRALALSGLELARELVYRSATNPWDAPVEGWDENPTLAEIPLGAGFVSLGYAAPDSSRTVFGLRDEARCLPWSELTGEILQRIPGLSEEDRNAILRRRDSRAPWGHSELRKLPELSPAGADILARFVTPYPVSGVNINTAPLDVLEFLGVPLGAGRAIVSWRNGPDGTPGTEDDRPFTTLLEPEGGLGDCHLDAGEAAVLSSLARTGALVVRSDVFTVSSRGWMAGNKTYFEIEAVLFRSADGALGIVDWSERWQS